MLFKIKVVSDLETLFKNAKEMAAQQKFNLDGDIVSGSFSGHGILGTYRTNGSVIEIDITQKPFIVGWNKIETKLNEFFGD